MPPNTGSKIPDLPTGSSAANGSWVPNHPGSGVVRRTDRQITETFTPPRGDTSGPATGGGVDTTGNPANVPNSNAAKATDEAVKDGEINGIPPGKKVGKANAGFFANDGNAAKFGVPAAMAVGAWQIGQGLGDAVGDIGEGLSNAFGGIGGGLGSGIAGVGHGIGQSASNVGSGIGGSITPIVGISAAALVAIYLVPKLVGGGGGGEA